MKLTPKFGVWGGSCPPDKPLPIPRPDPSQFHAQILPSGITNIAMLYAACITVLYIAHRANACAFLHIEHAPGMPTTSTCTDQKEETCTWTPVKKLCTGKVIKHYIEKHVHWCDFFHVRSSLFVRGQCASSKRFCAQIGGCWGCAGSTRAGGGWGVQVWQESPTPRSFLSCVHIAREIVSVFD